MVDFLWFWVSVGIVVETTRRSLMYCYPKAPNKPNADSLTEDLLARDDLLDKSRCPYGCCSTEILAYETDNEESPKRSESTDEIVSSEEIEEYKESLIDYRRKGKDFVPDDNGVQEIVGCLYPSAVPGRPQLVHFKVSDNYFQNSDIATARLAKVASAKIHPQPNKTADRAHSSMRKSRSLLSKDKQSGPSEEIADEYRTMPPIQEVMSSHDGNVPVSDEIQSSEGECSYKAN